MLSLDTRREPELVEMVAELRRRWPELREPRVAPWTEDLTIILEGNRPWLFGPIEHDPHARKGRSVVPRAQIRQLRALASHGLPVQRIAIAHELDRTGPVGKLIPMLRDGPRACTGDVAKRLVGPVPAHPGLAQAARLFDTLFGASVHTAAAGLDVLLDPIIFGVVAAVQPVPGATCLWYPLVAWRW
jgi:hypothetical protein